MLCFWGVDASSLVTTIASQGLLGVALIFVSLFALSKDKQLKEERDARIADAKGYNELALKLQGQVIDAVNKLAEILDEMKKFMTPPQQQTRASFGGRPP